MEKAFWCSRCALSHHVDEPLPRGILSLSVALGHGENGVVRSKSPHPSIDLHGMSAQQAMRTLVSFCNRVHLSGYRGWVTVVHGYGSTGKGGMIKQRVRNLVSHHTDALECHFNDDLNPGSTDVRILKPLPEHLGLSASLGEQIIAFCRTPKEESKIGNKFHRLPVDQLKSVLKELQASGHLVVVKTNGRRALQTVGRDSNLG